MISADSSTFDEVRARLRAHDRSGALALLEADRGLSIADPERSWLLAAIWTGGHRRVHARREIERLERGPMRDALWAVTTDNPKAALAMLRPRLGTPHPWRDLAVAFLHATRSEHKLTRSYARRAMSGQAPESVRTEAMRVLSRSYATDGDPKLALTWAGRAFQRRPSDSRNARLLSELYRRNGDLSKAIEFQHTAVSLAPRNERYARKLSLLIRQHQEIHDGTAPLPSCVHSISTSFHATPDNPELHTAAGYVARSHGSTQQAIAYFEAALARGAIPIYVDRDLRELYFKTGRIAGGYRLLLQALPPSVHADARNTVLPRWHALAASVAQCTQDARASRRTLVERLISVGALRDARAVASTAPDAADLHASVSAHLRFERSLRALVESDYRQALHEADVQSLDEIMARIPCLMKRHLAPQDSLTHAQVRSGLRDVFLVGSWLDHRPKSTSLLVQYFRRWNRYLIFGQRDGQPVEAIAFSMGSLVCGQPICTMGKRYSHDVVIGYDRDLRSLVAAEGGNLGGACLPDGIWLDADATREIYGEMKRSHVRDPYDAATLATADLTPATSVGGVRTLGDGGSAASKLIDCTLRDHSQDSWGSFNTLRAHEFGHIADLRNHYPLLDHLPSNLALLAQSGFSPTKLERALERKAQLGAVVDAPNPDLAVAEMLQSLPLSEDVPEVHAGGYHDGLADMVAYIAGHPAEFPQIDRRYRIVDQLARLNNAELKRVAREVIDWR